LDSFVEVCSIGGAGPRVAVKDCIDVAGLRTRLGSRTQDDALPAMRSAAVVEALLAAGCRIVGKARMHEFAYGVTGVAPDGGGPTNPDHPEIIPGGSSSGSATAVAAGDADLALGTDTGGSVRVPAACCGIYGLKPTFGLLSRAGVTPSASSLDCVGLFAPHADALARGMAMLQPGFGPLAPLDRIRVGMTPTDADPTISSTIEQAIAASGLEVVSTPLPDMQAAFQAGLKVIAAETWRAYRHHAKDPRLGVDVAARLAAASRVGQAEIHAAEAVRAIFTVQVDHALQGVDALVLPSLPDFPPTRAEAADPNAVLSITALVRPFNLSGHPAISIPLRASCGRPIGLQIIGRKGEDARLCALAALIEKRAPNVITRGI
jgi:amidase